MTTDANATYYDLDIRGTTVETRDIVRAVLERAGLGADASHQLDKLLERAIRLGAKPGTDVAREVEKIAIEAGMLREAVSPDEHRGLTADDARKWRGLRARIAELECEREAIGKALPARLLRLGDRSLPELVAFIVNDLAQAERERDKWEECARMAERDRDKAYEDAARTKRDFEHERRQHYQTQWQRDEVRTELAALRERYRPRRQSEEPAPDGAVLMWANWAWAPMRAERLGPDDIWTHQPPAPEREGE